MPCLPRPFLTFLRLSRFFVPSSLSFLLLPSLFRQRWGNKRSFSQSPLICFPLYLRLSPSSSLPHHFISPLSHTHPPYFPSVSRPFPFVVFPSIQDEDVGMQALRVPPPPPHTQASRRTPPPPPSFSLAPFHPPEALDKAHSSPWKRAPLHPAARSILRQKMRSIHRACANESGCHASTPGRFPSSLAPRISLLLPRDR